VLWKYGSAFNQTFNGAMQITRFFYKLMKFRNQARLCLAVFDFGALSVWKKFNSNVTKKGESL